MLINRSNQQQALLPRGLNETSLHPRNISSLRDLFSLIISYKIPSFLPSNIHPSFSHFDLRSMSMSATPFNKVERAHQLYREGFYTEALAFYSDALCLAKTTPQKIALHSNRAACFLKLHLFNKAADECTSVLELNNKHTGALMLRAQTLVTLKEYQSALFDVNRLLELNPSSEVYLNLQARLKTQLSLAPIPEVDSELEERDDTSDEDTSEDLIPMEQKDREVKQEECDTTACRVEKAEPNVQTPNVFFTPDIKGSQNFSEFDSKGWQTIPKPKGHARLDYSRWDSVEDDSSEEDDEDDDEETQPQYRFRVKNVDLRPVK